MMTRKHFRAVAAILRDRRHVAVEIDSIEQLRLIERLTEDFVSMFYDENPHFSREKFQDAVTR